MKKLPTDDDDRRLTRYLQQIAKTPLVSAEEEARLTRRIKQGDRKALEKLTRANLLFVVSIAKRYLHQGLSMSDLINEGSIGLVKAAKRFDETRGFRFISYAVWWIRQTILQALAEQSRTVRLPLNRISTLRKLGKTSSALQQELGRDPSVAEVAAFLNLDERGVIENLGLAKDYLSLDAPCNDGEDGFLLDVLQNTTVLQPDVLLDREDLRELITKTLDTLTPREAKVIDLYYGITQKPALNLEQIGKHLGVTRERVRQIKMKAMRRLRHPSRSRILRDYYDHDTAP
jgi:RNA polymerase primary sigma factor